jgi:phosphomannomutase
VTQPTIHFGTSGRRDIIADDFVFRGARRAAIAGHLLARTKSPRIVVGWLLMHASGPEPLVRIHAESKSLQKSDKRAEEARARVSQ